MKYYTLDEKIPMTFHKLLLYLFLPLHLISSLYQLIILLAAQYSYQEWYVSLGCFQYIVCALCIAIAWSGLRKKLPHGYYGIFTYLGAIFGFGLIALFITAYLVGWYETSYTAGYLCAVLIYAIPITLYYRKRRAIFGVSPAPKKTAPTFRTFVLEGADSPASHPTHPASFYAPQQKPTEPHIAPEAVTATIERRAEEIAEVDRKIAAANAALREAEHGLSVTTKQDITRMIEAGIMTEEAAARAFASLETYEDIVRDMPGVIREMQAERGNLSGELVVPMVNKTPRHIVPIVLASLLTLSLLGNGILAYVNYRSGVSADEAILTLQSELWSATEEVEYQKKQVAQTELSVKYANQSLQKVQEEKDDYMMRWFKDLSYKYFLIEKIGFIVSGSKFYHTYDCPTYKNSTEYWAHNIEYCKSLGYSQHTCFTD